MEICEGRSGTLERVIDWSTWPWLTIASTSPPCPVTETFPECKSSFQCGSIKHVHKRQRWEEEHSLTHAGEVVDSLHPYICCIPLVFHCHCDKNVVEKEQNARSSSLHLEIFNILIKLRVLISDWSIPMGGVRHQRACLLQPQMAAAPSRHDAESWPAARPTAGGAFSKATARSLQPGHEFIPESLNMKLSQTESCNGGYHDNVGHDDRWAMWLKQ